jgi:GNAT superfamily N-acetyltransferase
VSVITRLQAVAEFTEEETRALKEMKAAVYPDRPGETYPELAREWAAPEWGVFVSDDAGTLLSYTGIVIRIATVDGSPVLAGGIGGVATHPSHRGKGYAPLGIARALEFLLSRDIAFALLVCRDELVAYYESLGWRLFDGTVINTQFGDREVFTFNNVMVDDLKAPAPNSGTIDLQGPAW